MLQETSYLAFCEDELKKEIFNAVDFHVKTCANMGHDLDSEFTKKQLLDYADALKDIAVGSQGLARIIQNTVAAIQANNLKYFYPNMIIQDYPFPIKKYRSIDDPWDDMAG